MAAGGRRSGAGRPKGSIDPVTVQRRAAAEAAIDLGITPLEYMLRIMRDDSQEQGVRLDAAKAAAQYVHPKLAAIEHSGEMTHKHVSELSDDALADIATGGGAGAAETTQG